MSAKAFFITDFVASLFPLKTNLILIQNHDKAIREYLDKILSEDPAHVSDNFLPQTRVHAAKPRNHLRRTVVLDPIASYFLYDLVYRNRLAFGQNEKPTRISFGYSFKKKNPVSVHRAYKEFTRQVDKNRAKYAHNLNCDIASYFNSVYHHDATNWFAALPNVSGADANAFGRFFREINAGRSVDFLPQGIYPAKMIGSQFLQFVDSFGQVKCAQLLRFMDDIHLFDDDDGVLIQDFLRIQELLGLKGLNVNPTKTTIDSDGPLIHAEASAIQEELAEMGEGKRNSSAYSGSGYDIPDFYDDDDGEPSLDAGQIERLHELLMDANANESDVETILYVLHENTSDVAGHIPHLLARFPNIVKQLYTLVGEIEDREGLTNEIISLLESGSPLIEYQLFWIAVIAEDHLNSTKNYGKLVLKLYEKTAEHKIARAKILEIPDQSFGLKEIREEYLKTGASDWPSWAAAAGARTLKKAERNYALKYFSKGSPLNYLIADCVQQLP